MKIKIFIHYAIGPIFSAILGIITIPIMTWFFSTEDIGRLSILQVTLTLSVTLFSFGMHQSYVREYYGGPDKAKLLKVTTIPGFFLLISFSLFAFFNSGMIMKNTFGLIEPLYFIAIVVALWAGFFSNLLIHVIRMEKRALAFSMGQVSPRLLFLILIGFFVCFSSELSFYGIVLASAGSGVITFLILVLIVWSNVKKAFFSPLDKDLLKRMVKFSAPLAIGSFAYWGLTTIDRFMLKSIVGLTEVGIFSIAVTIGSAVSVVSVIFSSIWHPRVYQWIEEGVDSKKIFFVSEMVALLVALLWSCAGLLAPVVTYFLPTSYASVQYLLVLSVGAPLLYFLSETTVVGINISRKTKYSMFASLGALLVNIILNYILLPIYGVEGAVISSAISFFIFFILRTEFSSCLWVKAPRIKIYLIILLYLILSTLIMRYKPDYSISATVWLLSACASCLIMRRNILDLFNNSKWRMF